MSINNIYRVRELNARVVELRDKNKALNKVLLEMKRCLQAARLVITNDVLRRDIDKCLKDS